MTYKERQELNELSKKVFGRSSQWQKMVNGVVEPMERDREVMVPTKNGFETKTFTDKKSVVRRYTVEEVREIMEGVIARNAVPTKESLDTPTEG